MFEYYDTIIEEENIENIFDEFSFIEEEINKYNTFIDILWDGVLEKYSVNGILLNMVTKNKFRTYMIKNSKLYKQLFFNYQNCSELTTHESI
jgi:hypothetical protein